MHRTKLQKTVTVLIIAAMAAAVGCGDGKRSKRQRVERPAQNKAGQKPLNTGTQGTNGGNGGAPTGQPQPAQQPTAEQEAARKAAEEKRKQKDSAMNTLWQHQVEGGVAINVSDLEEGTYTFDSTATHVRILPGGSADWVKAVTVSSNNNGTLYDLPGEKDSIGLIQPGDDHGYAVLIPASFTIESRPWQPKRAGNDYLLRTMLQVNKAEMFLENKLMSSNSAQMGAALMDVLAGNTQDAEGKKIVLKSWKTQDGRVRFHLFIEEISVDKTSDDKPSMFRDIIVTYKFDKKAPAQQQTAAQPPAAQQTPVTVDQ